MSSLFHPALSLILGAGLILALRGRFLKPLLIAVPLFALWNTVSLIPGESSAFLRVMNLDLQVLEVDSLSFVFGFVFSLIALIATIYAFHVQRVWEHACALAYAGGALGVVFAGDWLTLFVFWEFMAIASFFLIWFGGSKRSKKSGLRYLFVHAFGGGLLLAGILCRLGNDATLDLGRLFSTQDLAYWLILFGVIINAAVPPLHAWLTDAYPEASVTGSVFLSVFTTKTAVYVLIRVFPGSELLVILGVIMALYGVVYAVLENDIRRLLAYHIISQVGYMVAGVGMGTPLALNGSAAHAFCHILYKSLLFMGAGAAIYLTGKRKLSDLGGIWKKMRWVVLLYMVGAVSISGFPFFNGFVSKSMVISAATYDHRSWVELLLTLASVGTFLHTGLKLPYFTFFNDRHAPEKNKKMSIPALPKNMYVAMAAAAFLCFMVGVLPGWLYSMLPFNAEYHPYTADHLISAYQLLAGTAIGFWILIHKLGGERTISADTDWIYRGPLRLAGPHIVHSARTIGVRAKTLGDTVIRSVVPFFENPFRFVGASKDILYDENVYRFSIVMTLFWAILGFVILGIFVLFLH